MGYQGNYPPSTPLNPTQLGTGVVTTDAIANGAVIPADLSTGGPYWDSSGNVGIGTTSPTAKLDVSTNINLGANYLNVGYDAGGGTGWGSGYNSTYSTSNVRNVVTGALSSIFYGGSGIQFFTNTSQTAGTAASERMRIDTSGNVGIGTSSPDRRLKIGGSGASFGIDAGSGVLSIDPVSGGVAQIDVSGANALRFNTNSAERMRIDSSGNVGIGITPTTGYGALQVTTSTNGTAAYFGNGGGVHAYNGSGYYSSAATLSSGGTWTARATGAGIVSSGANGSIVFYTDTGLTSGNTFNPTSRMSVGSQIFFQSQGIAYANQNVGTLRTSTGGLGGVMCESAGSGNAAFMCFHKPGVYASYFGIDTDNYFAVGGWSAGAGLANFKCNVMSKASGSFKIDHPLPEMSETHHLVHSFVEAPQADNIYRGKIQLVNGKAKVNIDQAARLTEGTFVLLNGNVQCFTTNETDWDAIRGSVNGNILTIESQDSTSTATISWLVIGERQDKHMFDTDWTDDNGRVITEPLKPETAFETNV